MMVKRNKYNISTKDIKTMMKYLILEDLDKLDSKEEFSLMGKIVIIFEKYNFKDNPPIFNILSNITHEVLQMHLFYVKNIQMMERV